jgi:ribosomal protein S18 acetylase RimI-like enzyme
MQEKVKTIYLEITANDRILFKEGFLEKMEVREIENDAYINFALFAGVGLPWRWQSRLNWTIQDWEEYFSHGRTKTYLGFSGNTLAGYYELIFEENRNAEIKFFGVLPAYSGKGFGGMLLSHAIKSSFDNGAARVWLHTCSKDSKNALGNYLARGFRIFREEEKLEVVHENKELIKMVSGFYSRYIDYFASSRG